MGPRNHSAGFDFFICHLKHRHITNIDIDGRGGVVRKSSPGLYHTPSVILLFLSSFCKSGLTSKNWPATPLVSIFFSLSRA